MKHTRAASIANAWMSRLLATVASHVPVAPEPKAKEDNRYGEPEVVDTETGVEVRLFGDVIPHLYAPWFLPGEAVSDVGFLHALDRIPADKAVTVTINSLGGDVFAGTVIANAVAKRKATTQVEGIAASIASVILAAGTKAHISRGATVMVHKPWSYAAGNAPALRAEADVLDKIEEAMVDIYVAKSGKKYSREQWRAALAGPQGADGSWWAGDEAVANGIADTYEQPEEQADAKRAAVLLDQRKTAAALYCSKLPKHLADPLAGESPESPKAPATVAPEAKQEERTTARRPGVSYLK
jgi:ATP-dependent Clp protease protease subunit